MSGFRLKKNCSLQLFKKQSALLGLVLLKNQIKISIKKAKPLSYLIDNK